MKKSLRLIALALTLATVLAIVPVFAVSAEEATSLVYECEELAYYGKTANGENWKPKENEGSPSEITQGGDNSIKTKAYTYTGGAVGYKLILNIDVPTAGLYTVNYAYRANKNYYADCRILVNSSQVGDNIATKSGTNSHYGFNKDIGKTSFNAGDNELVIEITGTATAFVPDSITLTPAIPDATVEVLPEGTVYKRYESESTPFVATDSNGDVINTSNEKKTWAWTMALGTTGLKGPLSGTLAYFRDGGINGTIDYKLDVDTAGAYDFIWSYRPNEDSNSVIEVLINGTSYGSYSQVPGVVIQDKENMNNLLRTIRIDNVNFTKGTNTVTLKMVEGKSEGAGTSGFTSDYMELAHRDAKTQVSLAGFTANLGGNIGLNFHMNMTDAVKADNAQVVFDVAGDPTTIPVADGIVSEHGIMFTCEVAAKQMTDNITVKVVTDTLGESNTFTYSVAKYATYIVKTGEPTFTAEEIALAKAMLNYGTEAQKEFNYNTESYANAALEESDKTVAPVDAAAVSDFNKNVDGTVAGISSNGTSLVLESATTLRLYFDLEDGYTVDNFTFKLGSTVLTANVVDDTDNPLYGKVYVDIVGITARNYDKAYTVTVSDTAESSTMTVSASIYACLNAYISSNKTVACAAYWYSVAAEAYFNK